MILCKDGNLEVNRDSLDNVEAFEHLLSLFNGNEELALLKYQEMFLSEEPTIESTVIDGFNASMQYEAIEAMKYLAHTALTGELSDTIPEDIYELFKDVGSGLVNAAKKYKNENSSMTKEIAKHIMQDMIAITQENEKNVYIIRSEFQELLQMELEAMGLVVNQDGTILEPTGGDFVRRNWNDNEFLSTSQKDTASTRIKRMLSVIPKVKFDRDESGNIILDDNGNKKIIKETTYLGSRSFARLSDVIQKIAQPLVDQIPPMDANKFDYMIEILNNKATYDPQLREIVNTLKNVDDPNIKTDFVNTFLKSEYPGSMLRIRRTKSKGGKQITVFDSFNSNRSSQVDVIRKEWYESQKLLPITTVDDKGNVIIDKSKIKDIKDSYIQAISNATPEQQVRIIQRTLAELGIFMPEGALEFIKEDTKEAFGRSTATFRKHFLPENGELNKKQLMGSIFDNFLSNEESDQWSKLATNNPVYGATEDQYIKSLAHVASQFKEDIYAPGYVSGEGNRVHSINDHNTLTQLIAQLKNNPENALQGRGVYESTSKILKALANGQANIRSIFKITYSDALKEFGATTGNTHTNMEVKDKHILRLGLLQNKSDRSMFLGPTLSDKPRDYIITLPNVYELFGQDNWNKNINIENGELTFNKEYGAVDYVLYSMIEGEYKRILEHQKWIENNTDENGDVSHPFGTNYLVGAQQFQIYNFLNPELTPDLYTTSDNENIEYRLKDLYQNGKIRDGVRRTIINNARKYLKSQVFAMRDTFLELDIIQDIDNLNNAIMDNGYLRDIPQRGDANKITYATLDYVLSNMFFNQEMFKISPGDLALHLKGDRTSTYRNLQKRLAGPIAPYIQSSGISRQESTAKVVTIDDAEEQSNYFNLYEEQYGEQVAKGYKKIESTDAQEYVTFEESLGTKLEYGELDQDLYDKIMDYIEDKEYYVLSKFLTLNEIAQLNLHPHKMVVNAPVFHNNLNTTNYLYRKTSSMPLLPEITKGSSIDNLRLAMEREGIDRVAYGSADKTGQYNRANVFSDKTNGTFDSVDTIQDAFKSPGDTRSDGTEVTKDNTSVQNIDRRYMGLQFQTPVKGKGIRLSSQMNKSLTTDSLNVEFDTEEETLTGMEIEERKQQLMSDVYEKKKQDLVESLLPDLPILDIEVDNRYPQPQGSDSRYDENRPISDQISVAALRELLIEEAQSRDWAPSAIASLDLTKADNAFKLPLSFNPASGSIESLLMSLIKKRIIDVEMYGKSYIQVSSAGFDNLQNSSITFTSDFEGEELGYYQPTEDTQTDKVPEVVIPWEFKDSNGDIIPMEDFMNENGRIDTDLIDDKLLQMIGFRLPNQGASSQAAMKIVGFLPPGFYKTMVVPPEIVSQMGADFDVDKVYAYQTRYEQSDNKLQTKKELSYVDSKLEEYKELHWTVLTNNEHIEKVLTQLDLPYLEREAKLYESKDEVHILSPHQQAVDHRNNHVGKDLVGVISNYSTLADILQPYNLDLQKTISTEDGSVLVDGEVVIKNGTETITLNQLGGHNGVISQMRDGDTTSLSQVISMYQNAALDNAKEVILDKLNATSNTINHIMSLVLLNNGEQTIPLEILTRLFNQEYIKRLDIEIANRNSVTNDDYSGSRVVDIIDKLQEEIVEELDVELDTLRNRYSGDEGQYTVIDKKVLVDGLKEDIEREDFLYTQFQALQIIKNLQPIVDEISKIQSLYNYGDRNGGGPSVLHAQFKTEEYREYRKNKSSIFDNIDALSDGTEWLSSITNSYILASSMYRNLFHYDNLTFNEAFNSLQKLNKDKNLKATDKRKMFRAFRSFIISGTGTFDDVLAERERLLFSNERLSSLAQRVKEAKETWGQDNFFIRRLETEIGENAEDPSTIKFQADRVEDKIDDLRIIQSIESLINSTDPVKRGLIEDLIEYTFIVQGGSGGYNTFIRYIPIQYLNKQGYGQDIKELLLDGTVSSGMFFKQYLQHNPQEAVVVERESTPKKISANWLMNNIGEKAFTFGSDGNKSPIKYFSIYNNSDYEWSLYKHNGKDYVKINTLGNYNINEYSINGVGDSSIPDNNVESIDIGNQSTHTVENFTQIKTVQDNLLDLPHNTEFSVTTGLQYIIENSSDGYYVELAQILNKIDAVGDIPIRINKELEDLGRAYKQEGIIEIRAEEEQLDIQETLLHEVLHHVIYDQMDNNRESWDNISGQIKVIRDEARTQFWSNLREQQGKEVAQQWIDDFKKFDEGDQQEGWSQEKINQYEIYYGLRNRQTLDEFMIAALTNKNTMEMLNEVEISKDKSLYEQFIDTLMKMFKALYNSSNIEVNENSALYITTGNLLSEFSNQYSIDTTSKQTKSDPSPKDYIPFTVENVKDKIDRELSAGEENLVQHTDDNINNMPTGMLQVAKNFFGDDVIDYFIKGKSDARRSPNTLNQTIVEFVNSMSSENKKGFNQIRDRIKTTC